MVRKNGSYESMMEKLDEIVSIMDNKDLALDESMKRYEEGIMLCNKLYKILSEAEGKIKLLTEDGEKEFQIE